MPSLTESTSRALARPRVSPRRLPCPRSRNQRLFGAGMTRTTP
jgi:hypothetical protein